MEFTTFFSYFEPLLPTLKVIPYKSPGPLFLSSGLLQGGNPSIMILKCMCVGRGSSTTMLRKVTVLPPDPWPWPRMLNTQPPAVWWNLDLRAGHGRWLGLRDSQSQGYMKFVFSCESSSRNSSSWSLSESVTLFNVIIVNSYQFWLHHFDVSLDYWCVSISKCSSWKNIKTLIDQSFATIGHSGLVYIMYCLA